MPLAGDVVEVALDLLAQIAGPAAGIQPGRRIMVHGRGTRIKGERTIYNPVYELQPSASAADSSITDLPSPG